VEGRVDARIRVSALTVTARAIVDIPPVTGVRLALIDAFELRCDGEPQPLPPSAQRVVAFVALHDHPLMRDYVAGALWLETSEDRAYANLRSALWRLRRPGYELVRSTSRQLCLAPAVSVDYRETTALAHRLLSGSRSDDDFDFDEAVLFGDLLPDWYEDWVLIERERFRQLRLHALEALCERRMAAGRLRHALEAALAAVAAEPLRESAQRTLIKLHLAEGNYAEAVREYRLYRELLNDQLGLEPSPQMQALVHELMR
jgi:DNA-binding SARP family transcriptional activator